MRPGRDGVHRHRLVASLAEQLGVRRQEGPALGTMADAPVTAAIEPLASFCRRRFGSLRGPGGIRRILSTGESAGRSRRAQAR